MEPQGKPSLLLTPHLSPSIVSPEAVQPTRPNPDAPEVLAHFHAQLDLVDLNARQVARRLAITSVTLDDLRSFGREGLLQAARTFDESRGVPFRRWANLRIRGAMIDGVRQWGSLPRRIYRELRAIEAADRVQETYDEEDAANPAVGAQAADARVSSYLAGIATAMTLGSIASPHEGLEVASSDDTPEELAMSAELIERVKGVLPLLPEGQRALIERHYFGDETIDQAAASLGLSKSWGSRLHARAIESISRHLRRGSP
jgi:RNA polymerase sigma factor for flagellar operon FliA